MQRVNARHQEIEAKKHLGQGRIARWIKQILKEENYISTPLSDVKVKEGLTQEFIQDRYSLRCSPQIFGPVLETIEKAEEWLELEIHRDGFVW